jgi:hypothetical protein
MFLPAGNQFEGGSDSPKKSIIRLNLLPQIKDLHEKSELQEFAAPPGGDNYFYPGGDHILQTSPGRKSAAAK